MTEQDEGATRRQFPSSLVTAFIIFALVVLYFALGTLFGGNNASDAETESERPPFNVLIRTVTGESRAETVNMTGRTEAAQRVTVRAETPGRVARLIHDEGETVTAGNVLCLLEADSREATRAEAAAAFRKANVDYEAARTLHAEGFAADTALNQARAARDAAEAALSRATDDLKNISITAPFSGLVAETLVESGDVLSIGAPCAILADLSEMIMAGGVPSRDAARLSFGDKATIRLVDGREFPATIRFVSEVADPQTRSFRVELFAEGATNIPEGIEARAEITAGTKASTLIPRNALVYSDEGELGVRTATPTGETHKNNDQNLPLATVRFLPVTVIGESSAGIFVSDLSDETQLIVRGQDYVSDGITVTFLEESE